MDHVGLNGRKSARRSWTNNAFFSRFIQPNVVVSFENPVFGTNQVDTDLALVVDLSLNSSPNNSPEQKIEPSLVSILNHEDIASVVYEFLEGKCLQAGVPQMDVAVAEDKSRMYLNYWASGTSKDVDGEITSNSTNAPSTRLPSTICILRQVSKQISSIVSSQVVSFHINLRLETFEHGIDSSLYVLQRLLHSCTGLKYVGLCVRFGPININVEFNTRKSAATIPENRVGNFVIFIVSQFLVLTKHEHVIQQILNHVGGFVELQRIKIEANSSFHRKQRGAIDVSSLRTCTNLNTVNLSGLHVGGLDLLDSTSVHVLKVKFGNVLQLGELVNFRDTLLELDLQNSNVQCISGIENCTKLRTLNLRGTSISDISMLDRCPDLQCLNLSYVGFLDLQVLSTCIALTELSIEGVRNPSENFLPLQQVRGLLKLNVNCTNFNNFGLLEKCRQLETLNIDYTKITEFGGIGEHTSLVAVCMSGAEIHTLPKKMKALVNLKVLDLSSSKVTNIESLSSCTSLQHLNLADTFVTDISALGFCEALVSLDARGTNVSDVTPLTTCKRLVSLFLRYTHVTEFEGLDECQELRKLDLAHAPILPSSVRSLTNCTNLLYLDLSNTLIVICPLKGCVNLHTLVLQNSDIQMIGGLSKCVSLHTLQMKSTKISDISALSSCKMLHTLDLSNTPVESVYPLSTCSSLHTLNLSHCSKLTDLNGLQFCSRLYELDLESTLVEDVSLLQHCPSLAILDLSNTKVCDIDALGDCKSLTELNLARSTVTNVAGLSRCKTLQGLNLALTEVTDVSPLKYCPRLQRINLHNSKVYHLDDLPGVSVPGWLGTL